MIIMRTDARLRLILNGFDLSGGLLTQGAVIKCNKYDWVRPSPVLR